MGIEEARLSRRPSPYCEWRAKEGVPVIDALFIPDARGEIQMAEWSRKGVPGAFLNLLGSEESLDCFVVELPPAKQTRPERYVFEEEIIVLSGRGATSIWTEESKKHTFEWQEGSVFSPPMNCWRQHFNGSADEPARFLVISTAPVMLNLFRSESFIFNCSHVFADRFSGEEDFFSGQGEALPNRVWRTNFVSDIRTFTLKSYAERGAGGSSVNFEMANNTMQSHVASFPVATYKMAHRHGPGAHILILSGQGYSLMWEEGKSKQRIDWRQGTLLVPPDMWFHQHFNTGSEPARYFAVHYGMWRIVIEDLGPVQEHRAKGLEISYEDEDPEILLAFQSDLSRNGVPQRSPNEWRITSKM